MISGFGACRLAAPNDLGGAFGKRHCLRAGIPDPSTSRARCADECREQSALAPANIAALSRKGFLPAVIARPLMNAGTLLFRCQKN